MLPATKTRHHHLRAQDAGSTYAGVVLGDNPSAYYRLDDTGATALDGSGNNRNGSVGTAVTENVPGLLTGADTAMTFPGGTTSTGVVNFPEVKAMEPTTNVSLETWLRFTTVPKIYTTAVAYGSDRADAPYSLFFRAGGTIVAQFYTSTGVLEVKGPVALAANTTYHLVSTFDGTTGKLVCQRRARGERHESRHADRISSRISDFRSVMTPLSRIRNSQVRSTKWPCTPVKP